MKLLYLANIRLPTEKAHGLQIMKMSEAFARAGADVELVVPRRRNPLAGDPFEYYEVAHNFRIRTLSTLDSIAWGFGYWIQLTTFAFAALIYALRRDADVYYSRDEFILYLLSFFRTNLVWESHTGRYNVFVRHVLHRASYVVVITKGLRDFYVERGLADQKIIVAHDAVDLADFENTESQVEARARLGFPSDKKIALYIGRLDGWKGTGTLCEAASFLPPQVLLAIIGGEPREVSAFRKKYPHVHFVGYRPYREIADNQAAADVLVLPNTGRDSISVRFTSPLKLFTYMASGKPIVASDLPSIREVLDDGSAYFVAPDDPRALARGISVALEDRASQAKSVRAREIVTSYTWDARAERILDAVF